MRLFFIEAQKQKLRKSEILNEFHADGYLHL